MASENSITEAITSGAEAPRVFETDGQKVGERSMSELIEADKYLTSKKRANRGNQPFRISKVRPSGVS